MPVNEQFELVVTPTAGLEDIYVRLGYKVRLWNLRAILHDFSAESGSASFGSELDLLATRKLGERYDLMLKFAAFDSDNAGFRDVTKAWFMFSARF